MLPEGGATLEEPYLRVDCEIWVPAVRRDDLAETEFLRLGGDLLDVFKRVFPFFFRWAVCRCILQAVWSALLDDGFFHSGRLASSFDGRQAEGHAGHRAEQRLRVWRVVAVRIDLSRLRLGIAGRANGGRSTRAVGRTALASSADCGAAQVQSRRHLECRRSVRGVVEGFECRIWTKGERLRTLALVHAGDGVVVEVLGHTMHRMFEGPLWLRIVSSRGHGVGRVKVDGWERYVGR